MARVYGNNPNHWQAYCDYSTSSTDTATTITVSAAGFRSVGWGFQLTSGVAVTAACTGQASKTGSGGFTSATGATVEKSFVSGSWAIARTTSAQTVTVTVTVANTSGYMNGTSTLSFQVSVPALASYAVSYNANGGSGAPAAQTKWHGTALKLSTAVPARSGYTFKGWATSASGSAAYQPGASYTANAAATLYAVWQLAYQAPTISSCSAQRCSSAGTAADAGTYAKVTVAWSVSTAYNPANKATSVKVEYRKKGATAWTAGSTQTPNAASGTLSAVVGGGALTADDQWEFRVTVADSGGSSTATCSVAGQYYALDVGNKGRTVAVGKAASDTAGLEVAMAARFSSTVLVASTGINENAAPSAAAYGNGVGFTDANGTRLANLQLQQATNGRTELRIETRRNVSGALKYNSLNLGLEKDGSYYYSMSSPAAFRTALGWPTHHTSGSWRWIKHNDGSKYVEMVYHASLGSVACTTSYGYAYYAEKTIALPVTLASGTSAQITVEASTGLFYSSIYNLSGTSLSYRIASATSLTTTVIVNIRVAGYTA